MFTLIPHRLFISRRRTHAQRTLKGIVVLSAVAVVLALSSAVSAQHHRVRHRTAAKPAPVAAAKTAPPPATNTAAAPTSGTAVKSTTAATPDLSVTVAHNFFGSSLVLGNRDKRPLTVRKLVINEEWSPGAGKDMLHSTRGWVALPVELQLGDTLRVGVGDYARAIIYIDLDTDRGAFTFKVGK
jgi:hypothetical protein